MLQRRNFLFGLFAISLCPLSMAAPDQKLNWNDLISQDPGIDFARIFSFWPSLEVGRVRPIGMSAFGACFFERPDGTVHVLDPLVGKISKVATSVEDFGKKMNTQTWQEEFLHSVLVSEILRRGLQRTSLQVFGFAPHPRFGKGLDAKLALVLDAPVWHSISAQSIYGTQK